MKGKQLFPHDLVQQVLNPKSSSDAVCVILNVQWEAVRNGLLGMVAARKTEQTQASMLVDNVETLVADSRLCTQSAVLSVALDVAIDSAVSRSCSRAQACKFTDTRSNLLRPVGRDGGGVHLA